MRKLNVHKLVKNLNELCENLQDKYHINWGGCCFIAYEIAKHLDRLEIEYSLHIMNDYCLRDPNIAKEIRSKQMNKQGGSNSVAGDNTCCHYYLFIYGGGSVNLGPFSADDYYVYTVTEINHKNINWLYRNSSWNSAYDTRHNKFIKKLSVLILSNMEKSVKPKYAAAKVAQCPRCKFAVKQDLFDYEKAIYKCTKCGNIHA